MYIKDDDVLVFHETLWPHKLVHVLSRGQVISGWLNSRHLLVDNRHFWVDNQMKAADYLPGFTTAAGMMPSQSGCPSCVTSCMGRRLGSPMATR
jgi:hypothetical protein